MFPFFYTVCHANSLNVDYLSNRFSKSLLDTLAYYFDSCFSNSLLGVLPQSDFLASVSPLCVIRGSPPPRGCPEHHLVSLVDQTRMFLGKDPLGIFFLRLIWC